jgi:hypothetical protein
MKKVIVSLLAIVAGISQVYAQCSDVINNYELKLSPKGDNSISIQMRHRADKTVADQSPTAQIGIDGLVFAIAWPTTSDITIGNVSTSYPFSMYQDKAVGHQGQNKTTTDNMATFYHNSDMPNVIKATWKEDVWYDVATISYSGTLQGNDIISFVTCEYGLSHPNSYSGNSHTDPWFMMMDMASHEVIQYSPKMITELPSTIQATSYKVYPNPSSEVFNVDIQTELTTQVGIQLLDASGRVVKTDYSNVVPGLNKASITVADITPGNYTIKITDGKTLNYIQKVQKQ